MDAPSTPPRRRSSWGERIAFLLLVVVPFLLIASCVIWGHYGVAGTGCGHVTVRVSGRLVDAETGEPLAGVPLMAFSSRAGAQDPERVAYYKRRNAEALDPAGWLHPEDPASEPPAIGWGGYPVGYWGSSCPEAMTAEDGSFQLLLQVPFSGTYSATGRELSSTGDGPREGMDVLRIERSGQEAIIVDVPHGTWEHAPEGTDVWTWYASWDLGDVRVPVRRD